MKYWLTLLILLISYSSLAAQQGIDISEKRIVQLLMEKNISFSPQKIILSRLPGDSSFQLDTPVEIYFSGPKSEFDTRNLSALEKEKFVAAVQDFSMTDFVSAINQAFPETAGMNIRVDQHLVRFNLQNKERIVKKDGPFSRLPNESITYRIFFANDGDSIYFNMVIDPKYGSSGDAGSQDTVAKFGKETDTYRSDTAARIKLAIANVVKGKI